MNQAETLCHSSGPWKKHKYISKVGEGANAVYKYAKKGAEAAEDAIDDARWTAEEKAYNASEAVKKTVKDKTGLSAREKYNDAVGDYERAKKIDQDWKEGDKKWQNSETYKSRTTREKASEIKAIRRRNQWNAEWVKERRDTAHAAKEAYSKTPLGKAEGKASKVKSLTADSVQRGQEKIKKLFSSETKVTHTSNVTGGKSSTSKKVKYNSDGTKVTVTNTFYPKKKK